MSAGVSADSAGEPRAFVTTRWSLVLSAAKSGSGGGNAQDALAELCRTYWRPIFSFVCRRGYSTQDAQDLTQDFFVMILERNWLERADPHRGRFRSLLLKSLQNFLINASEKAHTRKRGGDVKLRQHSAHYPRARADPHPVWSERPTGRSHARAHRRQRQCRGF